MMDKLNILMTCICVMSCQGLVHQTNIDEVHTKFKSINEDVRLLIEDTQIEAEEKSKLKKIKDAMNNLENNFQNPNNTDEIEDFDLIKIDLIDFQKEINTIRENKIKRHNEKISKECVNSIKNEDYDLANKYLSDINDDLYIKRIVSEIYDGKKYNFRLVKNFADNIEIPERSLNVYKTLINEMGLIKDPDSIIQLIEGINKNIISKLPEAKKVVYELKTPLKNLAIDNLTASLRKRHLSKETDEMSQKIAYNLHDYKLFREISQSVVKNIFFKLFGPSGVSSSGVEKNKREFEQNLVAIESMRPIPKILLLQALHERLLDDGLKRDTIFIVLLTQNAIRKAKQNEIEEYKPIARELWEQIQDVKILIIRMFKKSILGQYYDEFDIATEIFDYDKDIFENIMRTVIKNIYGKMSTVDIIKSMAQHMKIKQKIIGYQAVFDNMKENNNLSISASIAPLLELNKEIDRILNLDLKDEDALLSNLHIMKKSFPSLILDVNTIIKTAVVESNYTDHDQFLEGLLQVGEYGKIIKNVVSDLYDNDTEKLLDYIRSQSNSSVRIYGYFALQDKLDENSVYLFDVAQGLKKIIDSKDYKLLTPALKKKLQIYKLKLPYSIRNAAFGEEIYIKNINRGGEYLYLESDKYNFDNERRSLFTWIPGDLVSKSKWILENTEEAGVYRIKNVGFDEYLFADGFKYGDDKRRVFSWTRGALETDESKWRLIPTNDGVYIKNVHFGEYIFAGKDVRDNRRRFTFTRRPKGATAEGKWVIEEFLTS